MKQSSMFYCKTRGGYHRYIEVRRAERAKESPVRGKLRGDMYVGGVSGQWWVQGQKAEGGNEETDGVWTRQVLA